MIEFSGKLSEKIRDRYSKKCAIYRCLYTLLVVVPLMLLAVLCLVLINGTERLAYAIGLIVFIAVMSIISLIPISKNRLNKFAYIQKIVIDGDLISRITYLGQEEILSRNFKSCKKIVDYGDCYYLMFSLVNDPSGAWVCQKDLLMQGTLEEFETMFEGKIVRKIKSK